MINVKNELQKISDYLHARFIGNPFEEEIRFKREMLKESLLKITHHFNTLLLTCDATDYTKLCSIFRLSISLYDARYSAYRDMVGFRPFDTVVEPSTDNIGILDESKVFNYLIEIPPLSKSWNIGTYAAHIRNINRIIDNVDIAILTIEEMTKYMSYNRLHDLIISYGYRINEASELDVIPLPTIRDRVSAIIRTNMDAFHDYKGKK